MKDFFKNIGPGTLVAAAFIGPGTVTVCTLAGAQFGLSLLWVMGVAIIATILMQYMAAKVGLVTQQGLAQVIRTHAGSPALKLLIITIVLAAVAIGNSAYEAGNISGGMLGLKTFFPDASLGLGENSINLLSLLIGGCAFVLLYLGNYKLIERSLTILVLLMSLVFMVTAIMTGPSLKALLKGLFVPSVNDANLLTVIALVGTTIVPYNLFLHASLVNQKWTGPSDLKKAKVDTIIAVFLGGVVSMAIIVAASAMPNSSIENAAELASSLEPLLGSWATYFMSIGLFAAGITSAITAPLAAAYVVMDSLGKPYHLRSKGFRAVWMFVLFIGVAFAAVGFKPIQVIQFAQVANGILLPLIMLVLIWVANSTRVMGTHRNTKIQNILALLMLLFALFLGAKSILKVFQWM